MSLEDKLDKLAEESYKFHGEMRASIQNLTSYVGAVNSNQKETAKKLDDHIIDNQTAHGMEVREKDYGKWAGVVALVLSGVGALSELKKHLNGH